MTEIVLFPTFIYILYELSKMGLKNEKLDKIVKEWEHRHNKKIDYYFRKS